MSVNLSELEQLYLASLKEETRVRLKAETGVEVVAINPEANGKHEPTTVEEAVVFKIEEVGDDLGAEAVGRLIYAADVAFRPAHSSRDSLKPLRDDECLEIDEETGIPKKILRRYTRKGGSKAIWRVGFGFRLSDGSIRIAVVRVEGQVPQMTKEQVKDYYLAESSSGLKLVEFLENFTPHSIFKISNENGRSKLYGEITLPLVRQFVIDKVPPKGVLQEIIVSDEYKLVEIHGVEVGLVSLALTQWANQEPVSGV